jgi:hypothetical protein
MGSGALMGPGRGQRSSFLQGVMAAGVSLAVVLLASSPGCGGTDVVRPDGGTVCNQGDKSCEAGTRCTNRNCVPTCDDGGPCPTGSYCEAPQGPVAICSPISPSACRNENDCPVPQICINGLCIAYELREDGGAQGCTVSSGANDKCAPDSICYQDTSTGQLLNRCLGLPHCGQDGTCPIGFKGSTCNQLADGGFIFPGKERICLYDFCVDTTNCPRGTACFHYSQTSQLGQCSLGSAGSPCFSGEDCFNSSFCQLSDGGVADGGLLSDGGLPLGTCVQ